MKVRLEYSLVIILMIMFFSCRQEEHIKSLEYLFTPSSKHHSQYIINLEEQSLECYNYLKDYPSYGDSSLFETTIYDVNNVDLVLFLDQIKAIKIDSSIDRTRPLLDGIGLRVNIINNEFDTVGITTNSPKRNEDFIQTYKYLDAFFELSNKVIKDYNSLCYLENVQDNFDYGLPLKKISENPFEYRIWGTVLEDHKSELIQLLTDLPDHTPIIFDVRNGSLSEKSNRILEEYMQSKMLYFYGYNGLLSLQEIKENEEALLKQEYKYPEFYGYLNFEEEVEKRIKKKWRRFGRLNTFKTKQELLQHLYIK